MVGHRDRPEAAVARRLQQHLDRRRAIAGVVGVHVQVDFDQRPLRQLRPQLRVPGRVVAQRQHPPVDRFEVVGDRPPVAPLPRRRDQLVVRREVLLQQLPGRLAGHRAGVDPAEEDLHQRPRHRGREHPLLRRVEGRDVERQRVAQRRRRDARRERLVHVDDVVGPRVQRPLDRLAAGDPHHLVAAALQLLAELGDEVVDRFPGRPPVRRDLGDRQLGRGHGAKQ